MSLKLKSFFVIILLSVLGACESEKAITAAPPPPAPSASKTKNAMTPAAKVPSVLEQQKDAYFYNQAGKRDPFQPNEVENNFKDSNQPRSPLERFALGDMQLTGIIWGIADPRALIRTPDGLSYIIRANTRIGKNKGRVSRVTKKEVFVEEEYRDPTGKLVIREFSFEIRKSKVDDENAEKLQLKVRDQVE